MEFSLLLLENLLSMLLIAAVGYFAARRGMMSDRESAAFSRLVVNIFMPCMILKAMQIELTEEKVRVFGSALVFSVIIHLAWFLLAYLLKKPMGLSRVERATLIYPNAGNLIFPLVSMLFGEEYVFYSCIFSNVQLLFMWTHGVSLIGGGKRLEIKKILLNPNILALILGLILLLTGISIPAPVMTAVSGFSNMVGPSSMMIIGMTIAKQDLLSVFKMKRAYLISLGRLVIFPLVVLAMLYFSGFLVIHPEYRTVYQIVFLAVSAPPAATVSQLAVMYEEDALNASIYNVMGVLCCLVTMPAMTILFQTLFS